MPPYYFRYDQETIRTFCLKFADAVAKAVPVYLYNIPVFTNAFALDTALDLLATGPSRASKTPAAMPAYMQEADRAPSLPGVQRRRSRVPAEPRTAGADGAHHRRGLRLPGVDGQSGPAVATGDARKRTALDRLLQEFLDWFDRFPCAVAIKEAAKRAAFSAGVHAGLLGEKARERA